MRQSGGERSFAADPAAFDVAHQSSEVSAASAFGRPRLRSR
jgi:hypothetical protein